MPVHINKSHEKLRQQNTANDNIKGDTRETKEKEHENNYSYINHVNKRMQIQKIRIKVEEISDESKSPTLYRFGKNFNKTCIRKGLNSDITHVPASKLPSANIFSFS